jgi:hypothetical protein
MVKMSNVEWSDWLDFNQETFEKIPKSSGVFMMHASMKILFIGGSKNMKKSIEEAASKKDISQATRVRYRKEESFETVKHKLIIDFKKRHEGQLPSCMNEDIIF